MKISFIGLGSMGRLMARRFLHGEHELMVYNRTSSKAAEFKELSAKVGSLDEAVVFGTTLFSMLRDDEASLATWSDERLVKMAKNNGDGIVVECSTLSQATTKILEERFFHHHLRIVFSPVIGSLIPAEKGQLILLPGGDAETIDHVLPLLSLLGSKIFRFNSGQDSAAVKLAVNYFFAAQTDALMEAVKMIAGNSSVEHESILDLLRELPIVSPPMAGLLNLVKTQNFSPQFPVSLVLKDLSYAAKFDLSHHSRHVLEATRTQFLKGVEQGLGEENIHAIWKINS